MGDFRVVLVEPEHEGNVGAVARAMGNFAFDDLCMVNPCPLGDEALKRAKHAGHILSKAAIVDTLDEAVKGCSLVVGTTGVVTHGPRRYIRIPMPARARGEDRGLRGAHRPAVRPRGLGLTQDELAGAICWPMCHRAMNTPL